MDQEIKKQWLAALKSGQYRQGKYSLQTSSQEFCCLGVLCDLAVKAKIIPEPLLPGPEGVGYQYGLDGRSGFLPTEVYRWAGLDGPYPRIADTDLSVLNDNGTSFNEIAALIERYL